MDQPIYAKSLQTDLINIVTRIHQMTISASLNVMTAVVENAVSHRNVDDYGHNIPSLDDAAGLNDAAGLEVAAGLENAETTIGTSLDGRSNESHCCICLEAYGGAHTAFKTTACSHPVGKSCLSRWLNSTSPNSNTCPYCRRQLFERPGSRPCQLDSLEEVTQLWTQVEQTMAKLVQLCMQLCEQRRERLERQDVVGSWLGDLLNEVNFEFFLNDVGHCLEYVEGPEPWVLIRRVDWHA